MSEPSANGSTAERRDSKPATFKSLNLPNRHLHFFCLLKEILLYISLLLWGNFALITRRFSRTLLPRRAGERQGRGTRPGRSCRSAWPGQRWWCFRRWNSTGCTQSQRRCRLRRDGARGTPGMGTIVGVYKHFIHGIYRLKIYVGHDSSFIKATTA